MIAHSATAPGTRITCDIGCVKRAELLRQMDVSELFGHFCPLQSRNSILDATSDAREDPALTAHGSGPLSTRFKHVSG